MSTMSSERSLPGMPRRLEVRRPVPPGSMSVNQLSTVELKQELNRRITNLRKERETLEVRLRQIEHELRQLGFEESEAEDEAPAVGDDGSRTRRKRVKNERPLIDVLHEVIVAKPGLTTRDAAEGALAAGYRTNSKTFNNIVGTALTKDDRFRKDDGKWYPVAEGTSEA